MKENWLLWNERFSAMAQREKLLVFCVGLFLICYLAVWFVISPMHTHYSKQQSRITNLTRQQLNIEKQQAMLSEALTLDYTAELVEQEIEIKQRVEQVNQQLATFSLSYIAPEKMVQLLQKILRKHKAIILTKFSINPVQPIFYEHQTQDESNQQNVQKQVAFYQHTMTVVLQGRYFELLSYLDQINQIEEKLFVESFNYRVDKYPTGELTLTIATVSANEEFIVL